MSLVDSLPVKYGNTFRRFSVHVDENNQVDLNMVGLKAKIQSFFNFSHANFNLRYVDEEGDLVNLVDDDDLHDMMSQQLKFLRIEVHMIKNLGKKIWKEIIFNEEKLFYSFVYVFVVVVLGLAWERELVFYDGKVFFFTVRLKRCTRFMMVCPHCIFHTVFSCLAHTCLRFICHSCYATISQNPTTISNTMFVKYVFPKHTKTDLKNPCSLQRQLKNTCSLQQNLIS